MPSLSRTLAAGGCLVLLLAAGCGGPAATPARATGGILVSGSLVFALTSSGERDGGDVLWTFLIQNTANTTSTAANLHISVKWSGSRDAPVQRDLQLPPLAAGDAKPFRLTTPYAGAGDYSGMAEIASGGQVVARDPLFFETCAYC